MKTFDNQHLVLKGTDDVNAHLENMGSAGYQLVSGSWSDATETFDLFFTKEVTEGLPDLGRVIVDAIHLAEQEKAAWVDRQY